MKKYFYIACVMVAICSFSARSNAELAFEVVEIPGVANIDKTGPYIDVLTRISNIIGLDVSIKVSPVKRAVKNYTADRSSCLFPTSAEMITQNGGNPADSIFSIPVNRAHQHIFSDTSNRSVLKSIADLKGLNIAHRRGWQIPVEISSNKTINLHTAENDFSLYAMLKNNRVDAIIGWLPDFNLMYEENQLEPLSFDNDLVLFKAEEQIGCHSFSESQDTMFRLNAALTYLETVDDMKKILGPAYVDK